VDTTRAATASPEIEAFLAHAPKVELHLHLVGSASSATLTELAARHPDAGVPRGPADLATFFEFRDFPHFIDVYSTVNDLVRAPADVTTLLVRAAEDLASHQVRYAEVTVTPVMHEMRGLPHEGLVEGLDDGRRLAGALGVELAWIYDIPGQHGQPAAERTVMLAVDHPPDGLVGFGLAGAEAGVARPDYAWAFDRAMAAGLRSVPHAGEGDGPASVRAALDDLRADRIGHGVRAVEDPALVAELAERRVPLDVCPSSNVCTRVYDRIEDHPVAALVDAGVVVTINTDDPHMFGTDLSEEYRRLSRAFGLGVPELAQLVVNGIEASFLPVERRRRLAAEVAQAARTVRMAAGDDSAPPDPSQIP
jgi:aminodeoxyfutalosine deaminase